MGGTALGPEGVRYPSVGECQGGKVGVGGWVGRTLTEVGVGGGTGSFEGE